MDTQYTFDEREKSLKKNDGRMKKGHGQEEPNVVLHLPGHQA